ncbi:hypothetical protein KC338_g8380 [Hortaea werneckii]|uniref:Heterokaryon incompatibility domain-containing protein n=1 Tax=Hortaea werneckii TaxID=91943 RepID=A0A3M7FU50_HORWE|nr:hypothetical protein KC338_g8380 [Hortaea werneckii]KAI6857075.1 hypothetical protein KC323_g7570 [Hortaea werneckii]KAI7347218.1 hypothetical protein KC320_g7390 [Hortaea werneckii]RMY92352.1 hypothetical protein D0862_09505 [Hortaea werneckii]
MEKTIPGSAQDGIDPPSLDYSRATVMHHNQIYILHLDPGAPKQILKGRLELMSLSDPDLQYEFVAHNCRHSTRTDNIVVNDVEMTVPGSLGDALRRLRCMDSSRPLWLDTICVDASSHQLSPEVESWSLVMRYKANALLVWLGEHHDFGAATFRRFVNTIASLDKMGPGSLEASHETLSALEGPMPIDFDDGCLQSVVAKKSGSRVVVGETEADYETTIKALRWMKSFGHESPSLLADWKI